MKNLLVFFLFALIVGCNNQLRPLDYYSCYKNMHWLEGSWQGTADGSPFCESWSFVNDTLLMNKNLDCVADSVTQEGALIQVMNHEIYYTNQPKAGEKQLTWKLMDCDSLHVRFENLQAPYSQTITFEHTGNDQWRATLVTKGKPLVYVLERKK